MRNKNKSTEIVELFRAFLTQLSCKKGRESGARELCGVALYVIKKKKPSNQSNMLPPTPQTSETARVMSTVADAATNNTGATSFNDSVNDTSPKVNLHEEMGDMVAGTRKKIPIPLCPDSRPGGVLVPLLRGTRPLP